MCVSDKGKCVASVYGLLWCGLHDVVISNDRQGFPVKGFVYLITYLVGKREAKPCVNMPGLQNQAYIDVLANKKSGVMFLYFIYVSRRWIHAHSSVCES